MSPGSLLASVGARIALRDCDAVGEGVRLLGRPSIHNRGQLEIGRAAVIGSRPVATQLATAEGGALFIGDRVSIAYGCSIVAAGVIRIGEGTRIGPFAMVCDIEDDGLTAWRHSRRPIIIGRNVRVGSKVTILPGTYIPDGSEVAAGSIVSGIVEAPDGAADAGSASAPRAADVSQRITRVLRTVFDRSGAAPPSLALEEISGWNAGGALRLLLAVEAEFATKIPNEEWLAIRSVRDLVSTVERCAASIPPRDSTPPRRAPSHVE